MRKILFGLFCYLCSLTSVNGTEIHLWHAFDGFLAEQFQLLADQFNQEYPDDRVVLTYKGNYSQTFELGVGAFRKGEGPDILQIPEFATQSAMDMDGVFYPIQNLMTEYDGGFDPARYVEVVRKFYSTANGQMLSLPWNISTGILYYNKDAFAQAGLDPEQPPKTFEEFEQNCLKLRQAGYAGFTTAWPAAYHVEHIGSGHNVPFASNENGYAGPGAPLLIGAPLYVYHLQKLVEWQREGFFQYAGRFGEKPEELFTSGKVAMLLQGANRSGLLARKAGFAIGVGELPYWTAFTDRPYNPGCGGASFWTLRDRPAENYQVVADWFNFLSRADIQVRWHLATGYLPVTHQAYEQALAQNSIGAPARVALETVFVRPTTINSIRARLPDYPALREKIIDLLEMALREEITPQAALDAACGAMKLPSNL